MYPVKYSDSYEENDYKKQLIGFPVCPIGAEY